MAGRGIPVSGMTSGRRSAPFGRNAAAFRSLVQKTGTLHSETSPLDTTFHDLLIASQLEPEIWKVAVDAATDHVATAAGGSDAALSFSFARSHLNELARYRVLPPATESTSARLAFIESAWQAIDFAMASLHEIRFDSRVR